MNNADKFKSTFGLYATEVWAMLEKEFIDWLNKEDDGHTIEQKQKGAKMDELISRAAVEDLIMETDPFWCEGMTRAIFEGIKRLPTIAPVKHGKWIEPTREGCLTYDKTAYAECSECGKKEYLGWGKNYCPHCGAKMEMERSEE